VPVDQSALVEAEAELRAAVVEKVEQAARIMVRDHLIANPSITPGQLLNGLFPDAAELVGPDAVINSLVLGIRAEVIAVGAQRRLTWVGPTP
jgi:hypothetical protein